MGDAAQVELVATEDKDIGAILFKVLEDCFPCGFVVFWVMRIVYGASNFDVGQFKFS
jgi:hypothetical protein